MFVRGLGKTQSPFVSGQRRFQFVTWLRASLPDLYHQSLEVDPSPTQPAHTKSSASCQKDHRVVGLTSCLSSSPNPSSVEICGGLISLLIPAQLGIPTQYYLRDR